MTGEGLNFPGTPLKPDTGGLPRRGDRAHKAVNAQGVLCQLASPAR
ncbi:MAG: hypothetical protein K2Q09_08365 [Phycisphaerales bacterium]|nr:hypothetical protein [Phycisphaerales bacterium]